ncbi:cupredoxin domain-containing protein [Phaeovulum sp.]|uniref:cupredoxin domain-containing protein n=1 Tax=Phaeovulum sp. TaxID=2934796 RepID=UPI0039E280F6
MKLLANIVILALSLCLGTARATQADELPVIDVTLNDGVITPQHFEVEAGKPFKLAIKNIGSTAAEFESLRLYKEKVLAPGAESFLVFRKLSPGTYPFYDEFHMNLTSANGTITAK